MQKTGVTHKSVTSLGAGAGRRHPQAPKSPLRPEHLVTEVTDHRGKVIPNLYAAGEVTGE